MDFGPCDAFVELTPSGLLERIASRSIRTTVLEERTHEGREGHEGTSYQENNFVVFVLFVPFVV
jgi:hypothetical protein